MKNEPQSVLVGRWPRMIAGASPTIGCVLNGNILLWLHANASREGVAIRVGITAASISTHARAGIDSAGCAASGEAGLVPGDLKLKWRQDRRA